MVKVKPQKHILTKMNRNTITLKDLREASRGSERSQFSQVRNGLRQQSEVQQAISTTRPSEAMASEEKKELTVRMRLRKGLEKESEFESQKWMRLETGERVHLDVVMDSVRNCTDCKGRVLPIAKFKHLIRKFGTGKRANSHIRAEASCAYGMSPSIIDKLFRGVRNGDWCCALQREVFQKLSEKEIVTNTRAPIERRFQERERTPVMREEEAMSLISAWYDKGEVKLEEVDFSAFAAVCVGSDGEQDYARTFKATGTLMLARLVQINGWRRTRIPFDMIVDVIQRADQLMQWKDDVMYPLWYQIWETAGPRVIYLVAGTRREADQISGRLTETAWYNKVERWLGLGLNGGAGSSSDSSSKR